MKLKVKQTVAAVLTSATLLATPAAFASGIPTVDGAAIAQAVMDVVMEATQHAETIEQWTTQLQNMEQQIQNQIDHLNAIKGARGLDKVTAVLDTLEQIPEEWEDIYGTVQKIDPTKVISADKYDPQEQQKLLVGWGETVKKISKGLKTEMREIERLRDKAAQATDLKEASDIANAISARAAQLQVYKMEYDIMKSQFETQQQIAEERLKAKRKCAYREARGEKCS